MRKKITPRTTFQSPANLCRIAQATLGSSYPCEHVPYSGDADGLTVDTEHLVIRFANDQVAGKAREILAEALGYRNPRGVGLNVTKGDSKVAMLLKSGTEGVRLNQPSDAQQFEALLKMAKPFLDRVVKGEDVPLQEVTAAVQNMNREAVAVAR